MNDWIIYLVKSGLALCLFYGIYWLFLRKETYFSVNRFVLLGSVLLSFLIPLIPFNNFFQIGGNQEMLPTLFIDLEATLVSSTVQDQFVSGQSGFLAHWSNWLLLAYITGIGILLARLTWQLIKIIQLRSKSQLSNKEGMRLAKVNAEISPFSWFNYIFIHHSLPPEEDLMKIVKHEKAHYNKFHYIDLMIIGLAGLAQWFNPIMWLFDRSIREIHEFEADREVLRWNPNIGRYQALLVNQVTGLEIFRLANGFSKSLTKKRMIMMTKLKSRKIALVKILLLLPVMTMLLFAFTKPSVQDTPSITINKETISGRVIDEVSGEALPGAAIIIAGTTTGTVSDMQGKFMLEVESMDVTLVISFVGYKTLKLPLKGKTEIEVKMIRDVVEIENTGEMSDEKKKEIELKQKQQQQKEEELKKKQEQELKKKQEQEMRQKQEQDQQQDEELFYIVEEMPSFQGGGTEAFVKHIQEKVEEKKVAEKTGLSGTVVMKFTVNTKGKVSSVAVSESSGQEELDKIATVLINDSPDWKPGKQRGKPVAVEFKIPVVFK